MKKKQLRNQLLQKRKQQSEQIIFKKSEKICDNLIHFPKFSTSSHVLFYVSYDGEVHTHQLIKKAISLKKQVYVPISYTKTHTLIISRLHKFTDLTTGSYGILEPKKEKRRSVPITQIDTVIVPGVGFDQKGHRIGQGGGYYDWLLSRTKATSIALAFEFQMRQSIPTELHDQHIDYIVTEKRIIDCEQ